MKNGKKLLSDHIISIFEKFNGYPFISANVNDKTLIRKNQGIEFIIEFL